MSKAEVCGNASRLMGERGSSKESPTLPPDYNSARSIAANPDLTYLTEWLGVRFTNSEKLGTQTMQILCENFGHPEKAYACVHVAGSKGKGTISADIAAILTAAAHKVGVYASPHVSHFVERVGTGHGPFAPEIYEAAFAELKNGVERIFENGILARENVTWFELVTLFAMLVFRQASVDYAVLEVGLGGRLDATNVILPQACAFGLIELEHTRLLGRTLAEIAAEKAGILKPGVVAVSVAQAPEVCAVLRAQADEVGAEIEFLESAGDDYWRDDANVALRVASRLGVQLAESEMDAALRQVHLPGRFEILRDLAQFPHLPAILLDGAHTPESLRKVLARMRNEGFAGDLIFGCAKEKNVVEMARSVAKSGFFARIYLTRPGDFKKSDLAAMEKAFRAALQGSAAELMVDADFGRTIAQALDFANQEHRRLAVLGSFYLVGEAKKRLENERSA